MIESSEAPFLERYPYFPFLLSVNPYAPLEEPLEGQELDQDISEIQAEVLYIFGLASHIYHDFAKSWLEKEPQRQIVFIERDLAVIAKGLEENRLDGVFEDSRVHLCFSLEHKKIDALVEEVTRLFPSESVAVLALASYKKRYSSYFTQLKSALIRRSVITFAHRQESLHYHRLFRNMLPNFLSLEESFSPHKMTGSLSKIPALIVGAGPSLAESIPYLKTLKDKALLFAGGSTIIALENHGIAPHLAFAIDPNREEYTRLKNHRFLATPLVFGSRLMHQVLCTFAGSKGYVRTSTGGPFEAWMEEELELSGESLLQEADSEALSVTIIALKTAILLGCDPIIFVGLDLAYRKKDRYCKGILPAMTLELEKQRLVKRTAEMPLTKKGRKGQYVETAYKWVMESRCLSQIVKAHPEITFIDATEHGLPIGGAPYTALDKVILDETFDLDGMLHLEILRASNNLTQEKIRAPLLRLKESLNASRILLDEMIESPSHPKTIALEIDLKKELAYDLFLEHLEHHLLTLCKEPEIIWKECREVLDAYLKTMAEYGV